MIWTDELDSRLLELHGTMSNREVGAVFGCSKKAIEARIWRLRKKEKPVPDESFGPWCNDILLKKWNLVDSELS